MSPREPGALQLPALLFVDHPATGPEGHAVVLSRRLDGGRVEVLDPLRGRRPMTRDVLARVWHGRAIACRPSASR